MLNTKAEAISQVKNDLRLVHADRRLTNKYIYSLLDKHAAYFIKRESDKLVLIKSDYIWQTLNCVETIEVPKNDECCRFTSKCKILRTKNKIPPIYEDSWGVITKSVNSIDFSEDLQPIKMSEWTRKLDNPNSKYDKTYYYFYKDGYLYFPNCSWKLISVTAYFKDDIDNINLCDKDAEPICTSIVDMQWRVPQHLQAAVIEATIQELMRTYAQINPGPEVNINKNPS